MTKIAVLASFNMDLVMRTERRPVPGETLQGEFGMYLGGKGFNQAIAARRLGATVALVGRVGDDEFGRRFLAALDDEGIDRAGVNVDQEHGTGVASIVVSADGENAIIQAPRANRYVTAEQVAAQATVFEGAAVAMLQLETSMAAATEFARRARACGAITVFNPAPAAPVPAQLLQLTDVLVPNELEASTLTGMVGEGIDAALAMGDALQAQGPGAVVITLGAQGAVAIGEGVRAHVPAFETRVVDTVGAGDAFCAALALRLGEKATLQHAVRFACAAGAVACTREGAEPSMPRREEIDALSARGVHA
jgi:ribokinase